MSSKQEHPIQAMEFWMFGFLSVVLVLFRMLSVVAQVVYWSRIVSGLKQEHA